MHGIDALGREVGDGGRLFEAGAVHGDVDAAEAIGGRGHQGLHLSIVGDVAGGAHGAHGGGHLVHHIGAPTGDEHVGSFGGEQPADRFTETTVATYDDGCLSFEFAHGHECTKRTRFGRHSPRVEAGKPARWAVSP